MRPIVLAFVVACSRPAPTPAPTQPSATPSVATVAPSQTVAVAPVTIDAGRDRQAEQGVALPSDASCADVRCLIDHAYASDPTTHTLALALFDETGDVAGTDHESMMDGGFRGELHLLPQLPTGDARNQLTWVLAAARDFETFFAQTFQTPPTKYRWKRLTFRFFRSMSGPKGKEVQRTTPSAYAIGPRPTPRSANDDISYSLGYNVKGSLLTTETGVRETLFHEVFHMNDTEHGDWSPRALAADYDAILKRCGASNVACLRPYAPNDTMVRGGTFYAFQQNNGVSVREYAAELALRWYKEHRAILRKEPLPGGGVAFKCGPPENSRAWALLVQEFFDGVDRVPPCVRGP